MYYDLQCYLCQVCHHGSASDCIQRSICTIVSHDASLAEKYLCDVIGTPPPPLQLSYLALSMDQYS